MWPWERCYVNNQSIIIFFILIFIIIIISLFNYLDGESYK